MSIVPSCGTFMEDSPSSSNKVLRERGCGADPTVLNNYTVKMSVLVLNSMEGERKHHRSVYERAHREQTIGAVNNSVAIKFFNK